MSPPRILVGARVALYINGQAYGRVMGFQWTSTTAQKAVYALDSSFPYELAPGQTRIVGSLNVYRLAGDGGAEGANMTTQFTDVIRQNYFTLSLVDRATGQTLFQANHCALTSQSWSAPVRGFVTGSLAFESLLWESEVPGAPS